MNCVCKKTRPSGAILYALHTALYERGKYILDSIVLLYEKATLYTMDPEKPHVKYT